MSSQVFARIKAILAGMDVDYSDVRYEIKKQKVITFNGNQLTHVEDSVSDGYVVRVVKNGGMGTATFNNSADAQKVCSRALDNACLMARFKQEPVVFATVPVVQDEVLPKLSEDPRGVSLEEKIDLTRRYIQIPLRCPQVATASLTYRETLRERYFVSTEGSRIREDLLTTAFQGLITSKDGHLLQTVRINAGGSSGFAQLRNREPLFEERTRIASDLLKAQPFQGGSYPVLINGSLAGVLIHEAFGHLSEADLIEQLPSLRAKMQIGAKLGSDAVSIHDDPTQCGQLGHYKYDDEGVAVRPVQLMKQGVLTGRLHSRRTAAAMNEPVSGHCVAEDFRYSPMIRMGTIYLEPGSQTAEELLGRMGNGLYLVDPKGGATSGEAFTFGASHGWVIKNGRKTDMVRDVNISGNLFETLGKVDGVAKDLTLMEGGGACGKGEQSNIRSCFGAPHTLVRDVLVGGR